jgi:hypothetical protein
LAETAAIDALEDTVLGTNIKRYNAYVSGNYVSATMARMNDSSPIRIGRANVANPQMGHNINVLALLKIPERFYDVDRLNGKEFNTWVWDAHPRPYEKWYSTKRYTDTYYGETVQLNITSWTGAQIGSITGPSYGQWDYSRFSMALSARPNNLADADRPQRGVPIIDGSYLGAIIGSLLASFQVEPHLDDQDYDAFLTHRLWMTTDAILDVPDAALTTITTQLGITLPSGQSTSISFMPETNQNFLEFIKSRRQPDSWIAKKLVTTEDDPEGKYVPGPEIGGFDEETPPNRHKTRVQYDSLFTRCIFSEMISIIHKYYVAHQEEHMLERHYDQMWIADMWNLAANSTLSVALIIRRYNNLRPPPADDLTLGYDVATTVQREGITVEIPREQWDLIQSSRSGCRLEKDGNLRTKEPWYPLFQRCISRRDVNPTTITFQPMGIPGGINCVIACFCHFLDQLTPSEDLGRTQQLMTHRFVLDHMKQHVTRADILTLAQISNVTVRVTWMTELSIIEKQQHNLSHVTTFEDLYDSTEDTTNVLNLFIEIMSDGTAHAMMINRMFPHEKEKCATCYEWHVRGGAHSATCARCPDCSKSYNTKGTHHISCKGKFNRYQQTQQQIIIPEAIQGSEAGIKVHFGRQTSTKFIQMRTREDHAWMLTSNIFFADFECFADPESQRHIPDCVVIKPIKYQGDAITFYGRDCLKDFIQFIMSGRCKGYIVFHNGSGYDFNIVLRGLLEYYDITKKRKKGITVLKRGTKIIGCDIKMNPMLKLRDFFLFLACGLKRLCLEYKVPFEFAKKDYDHSKVYSWETSELHKVERKVYCKHDVLALEYIYKKFAPALFQIAPITMLPQVSLSSHAYEMWKYKEGSDVVTRIGIPNMETYDVLRQMYHGGRCALTTKKYDTAIFRAIRESERPFDEKGYLDPVLKEKLMDTQDQLKMLDVNSLYPSRMDACKFPAGSCKRYTFTLNISWWQQARLLDTTPKGTFFRRCYNVDMTAPQHLLIAFVMRKNPETGNPEQNLKPFSKFWITGIELYEAMKLGYKVSAVYEFLEWDYLDSCFKKYINELYKIKQDNKHDKTGALYQAAKLLMNGLSGKFGQRVVLEEVRILADFPEDGPPMNLKHVTYDDVYGSNGKDVVGFIQSGEKMPEDVETYLPTQLSVFILAYSRRHMSKCLRAVNGYVLPQHTIFYTDTDSMIFRYSTYQLLCQYKGGKLVGNTLGQLEDEFPKDIIIAGRFLAPKCYCLTLLQWVEKEKEFILAYKVRCKGIPHRGDIFSAREYLIKKDWDISMAALENIIGEHVKNIKDRYYVMIKKERPIDPADFLSEEGEAMMGVEEEAQVERHIIPYLNMDACDMLLSNQWYMECHYGTIERERGMPFVLRTRWAHRDLARVCWWDNPAYCNRVIAPGANDYQVTQCVGEVAEEDTIDWDRAVSISL